MKSFIFSLLFIITSRTFGYSHTQFSGFNERYDSYDILNQSQATILSGDTFSLTQKFFTGKKWKKGLLFEYKYIDLLPEVRGIPILHEKKSFLNGGVYLIIEINPLNEIQLSAGSVEKIFFSYNAYEAGIRSIYQSLIYQTFSYTKFFQKKRFGFGCEMKYLLGKESVPKVNIGMGGKIFSILKINKFDLMVAFSYESQNTDYEKQKMSSATLSIGYSL